MQILARINNTKTLPINVENEIQLVEVASLFGFQVTHFQPPFCNLRRISRIRGGKGGFGTLLKGQSRLASANTTKDFSACRDLQGRRLRTVNDEINQTLWKEWSDKIQAGAATLDDMAAALVNTQSGIVGWHLQIPAWAEVNPKKEQRRVKELLEQWKRTQDEAKAEKQKQQNLKEAQVSSYMNMTDMATASQVNLVKEAILSSQLYDHSISPTQKRSKVDVDPPAAFLTISGNAALDYTNYRWRLQCDANFSTVGIFLKQYDDTSVYYEIVLTTGGLCQVGWATRGFHPDSESGDGVGDDSHSWAYDGSRGIKLHAESSEPYGKQQWKAGDVIGCLLDDDHDDGSSTISYSINGFDLGIAFACENNNRLFPAISCNPGEVIELRIHDKEMDYRPDRATAIGNFLHNAANLDMLLFATSESDKNPMTPEPKVASVEMIAPPTLLIPIDLEEFASVNALEALGMDRLKEGLMAVGLKCGGTLQQRAERLFSIKGLTPNAYPKTLMAKKN